MLEAVLFDKDGVLVDSIPLYYEATRRSFEDFGYNLTKEEYVQFWINSLVGTKEFMQERRLDIDYKKIREAKEKYVDEIAGTIKLNPFARELLESLSGLKKAIVSSDHNHRVYDQLKHFGLLDFFDAVVSSPKAVNGKPIPGPYLSTCEQKLKISPSHSVVIEDTPIGAEAARLAGCKVIFFPNGFTADMRYDRADAVIRGLNEVTPEMLERLVEFP